MPADSGDPQMAQELPDCPDCGACVEEHHRPGCDVERCSVCKGQRLGCDCEGHDPKASAWQGSWPGIAECLARGWFSVMVSGQGWAPCDASTPGATPDLNRLSYFEQTGRDGMYTDQLG